MTLAIPQPITIGSAQSRGTSFLSAREDHIHPVAASVLSAGTYSPTLTNVTNIAASALNYGAFQYLRVGNQVTVSGLVDIDPTVGANQTTLRLSLPVASNFTALGQCAGVGVEWAAGQRGTISADTANDLAELDFVASDADLRGWGIHFTYTVA